MSINANNDKPPNQGCNNVVNIMNNNSANNSNHSSSSKLSKSSRPHAQSSVSPRGMKIHCGNKYTTNNYNQITTTKEKNEIHIQTFHVSKVIIITNNKNLGK